MDSGANLVQELQFIKTILWLWDQYEDNEEAHATIRELVRFLYIHRFPDSFYGDYFDLLEYVGGEVKHLKRRAGATRSDGLSGRATYEHDIQDFFGENSTQMTTLDQWLFADMGYYILRLGMIRVKILKALEGVLQLFEAKVPERIAALRDIADRVSDRIRVLESDQQWNETHNDMRSDFDSLDNFSLEWFYKKQILPNYPPVDVEDIDWQQHTAVGKGAYAHYFISRGRAYILVTAVDDAALEFTPSPMYELVKSHGHESLEIRGGNDTPAIPGLIGTYRLYAERSDSVSRTA